ncbi:MAG: ROK family protein [Eubacteriales bacterium]|nr:ROK family protein [Eubacteriales bacterium]
MAIAVFDIGGTFVKYAYFEDGELFFLGQFLTRAHEGGRRVLERVADCVEQTIRPKVRHLDAVSISSSGQINSQSGEVIYSNGNSKHYAGLNVVQILQKRLQLPVCVENDVNAAAYGELKRGAGRKIKDQSFICLTIGTGVGGAIINQGRIYHGNNYAAGEFGGIITHIEARRPGQNLSGCLERYASTKALVRLCRDVDPAIRNARQVFSNSNRPEIRACIQEWAFELALGLSVIAQIFNPRQIIIGGGIMHQRQLFPMIAKQLNKLIYPSLKPIKLLQAELLNQAGLMGAAYLAKEKFSLE